MKICRDGANRIEISFFCLLIKIITDLLLLHKIKANLLNNVFETGKGLKKWESNQACFCFCVWRKSVFLNFFLWGVIGLLVECRKLSNCTEVKNSTSLFSVNISILTQYSRLHMRRVCCCATWHDFFCRLGLLWICIVS